MQSTSEKWKVWVERGCQTLVLQCNRIKPATKLSRKRMSVSRGVFGQQLAGPEPAGRTLASLVESHTGKGCCGEQWHPLFMIFVCFQRGHGTRMQKGRLLNICVRSLLPSRSLLQKIYSSTVYHLSIHLSLKEVESHHCLWIQIDGRLVSLHLSNCVNTALDMLFLWSLERESSISVASEHEWTCRAKRICQLAIHLNLWENVHWRGTVNISEQDITYR